MKFIKHNLLFLTVIFFLMLPVISKAQIAIIANKNVKAKSIDNNALVNLYTLQSNEVGSQKIKLFFLSAGNETNKKFLAALNKTAQDLNKLWLRAKLTGNGNAPEFVSSERELMEKVASVPNAIGFVDQKDVSSDVKVLLVLH